MKTIILAGGKGTRLPVSGADKPKVLVEVAGKTILDRQIEWLLKHNLSDIRLALGFRAEQIINHVKNTPFYKNINIDYVVEPAPLGTGGAIKFALNGLKDDFLALNGDILADADLNQFIKSYKNACPVPFFKNNPKIKLSEPLGDAAEQLQNKQKYKRKWRGVPRGTFN